MNNITIDQLQVYNNNRLVNIKKDHWEQNKEYKTQPNQSSHSDDQMLEKSVINNFL